MTLLVTRILLTDAVVTEGCKLRARTQTQFGLKHIQKDEDTNQHSRMFPALKASRFNGSLIKVISGGQQFLVRSLGRDCGLFK